MERIVAIDMIMLYNKQTKQNIYSILKYENLLAKFVSDLKYSLSQSFFTVK